MGAEQNHGAAIEPKFRDLHAKITSLKGIPDELFKIIHSPGWTTLPEVYLLNNLIDGANQTLSLLKTQVDGIVEGSKLIAK